VHAAGGVTVSSLSDATVEAEVGTATTAIAQTLGDADSVTVGATIALNRLATAVSADIEDAPVVEAGEGDILVSARDTSRITADVSAPSLSISTGLNSSTAVGVGISIARNELETSLAATI